MTGNSKRRNVYAHDIKRIRGQDRPEKGRASVKINNLKWIDLELTDCMAMNLRKTGRDCMVGLIFGTSSSSSVL